MSVDQSTNYWRMCTADQTFWDSRYQSSCWYCAGTQQTVAVSPGLTSSYRGFDLPLPPEFIGGWTTHSG